MNNREIYLASLALALAFTGITVVAFVTPTVQAVHESHLYRVNLDDAWTGWNWFGSYIGIGTTAEGEDWDLTWYDSMPKYHIVWPVVLFNTPETEEDTMGYSNFVRVSCFYDFGTGLWSPWGWIQIERKTTKLYTDVYLQGDTGNDLVFVDWRV